MHYHDEAIFSLLPNAAIFSWFHHSNTEISLHKPTIAFLFLNIVNKNYSMCIPKNWPHDHASRGQLFSPTLESIIPFQSGVLTVPSSQVWNDEPMAMIWCKNLALFQWNFGKHLNETSSWHCLMFHWEQMWQPSCILFSHVQIFNQYTMYSTFWKVYHVY